MAHNTYGFKSIFQKTLELGGWNWNKSGRANRLGPGGRVSQSAQKWPEMAGSKRGCLQNRMRDFNRLARNPLGYRYTIPHKSLILHDLLSKFLQMASQMVPVI